MEYWFGLFEATISGPSGSFTLGNDPAGNIVIRGGQGRSGMAKLFLRRMSPANTQLSELYRHHMQSGTAWEQNTVEIRDRVNGNVILTCREVAFGDPPQGEVFELHIGKIEPAE